MRWKSLAAAAAIAAGALVLGALLGRPGAGRAAGGTAPQNTGTPTVTGTPQQGATLTTSKGTWNGSPTAYAYAWSLCDAHGDTCKTIGGATSATYTLTADDVGHTLRATVTATNGSGSTSATSVPTAVVSSASAPKNTALPTISGTAGVGSTLTGAKGTWTGTVTGYAYAWERCDTKGNSCSTIEGATSTTYTLTQADAGTTVRFAVTATNGGGSTTATSTQTAALPLLAASGCPGGTGAIQVADLAPPARLTVVKQSSSPGLLTRSTRSVTFHVKVTACGGRPVQGATVFAVAIPYNQFEGRSGTTAADGTVALTEPRGPHFPADPRQELLAVLIRASKPGASVVGNISSRRTVSFPVAR